MPNWFVHLVPKRPKSQTFCVTSTMHRLKAGLLRCGAVTSMFCKDESVQRRFTLNDFCVNTSLFLHWYTTNNRQWTFGPANFRQCACTFNTYRSMHIDDFAVSSLFKSVLQAEKCPSACPIKFEDRK